MIPLPYLLFLHHRGTTTMTMEKVRRGEEGKEEIIPGVKVRTVRETITSSVQ